MVRHGTQRKARRQAPDAPLFESLEPRLLLSADFAGGLADPITQDEAPAAILAPEGAESQGLRELAGAEQSTLDSAAAIRHELVLIDTRTPDHQRLTDDLLAGANSNRQIDVILLDAERDGVAQISEALAGRQDVSALHIISHGEAGRLELGGSRLEFDSLLGNASAIHRWGQALDAEADILIYGCDLAADEAGQRLVDALSRLTGADVAASTDKTGHTSLGGDWGLEYHSGAIESGIAFSHGLQADWRGTLNTYTVTNTGDSGVGSLRDAITQANGNTGQDTIDFNITSEGTQQTIVLSGALPSITDTVIIDARSQGDWVGGSYTGAPLVELDGSLTSGVDGLVLDASNSQIRGLVINGFDLDGILVTATASGNTIAGNYIGTDSTGTSGLAGNGDDGIEIFGDNNTIGGSTPADRNIISGNADEGIDFNSGAEGNIVIGNYIGTDVAGATAIANGSVAATWAGGILLDASNNRIGGSAPGEGNLISGNAPYGILLSTDANGNVIEGNFIGTDASGTAPLGNTAYGIFLNHNNASNNTIGGTAAGAGNLIAYNDFGGIGMDPLAGTGNAILGNRIFGNAVMEIDLNADGIIANDPDDGDDGANDRQNFPALAYAMTDESGRLTVNGLLDTDLFNQDYRIEFFSNSVDDGNGEGERYLGAITVRTNGSGDASFSASLPALVAVNEYISATATVDNGGGNYGSTSEFAQNVQATAINNVLWISTDADIVPPDGADGLPDGWTQGEVLQFGGPDLNLGPATDGDFATAIDFDRFTTNATDAGALHFVTRDLSIGSGANQFDLQVGDVLVSFNQDEDIQDIYYETGVQTSVHKNDLLAFRPDMLGDYTSGTFYTLLNGVPDPLGAPIDGLHAVSLVERDTFVGGTLLAAGTFIFTEQSGVAPNTPNHIYHFAPTAAGQAPAAGTSQILIDGGDIGIEAGKAVRGLELIERSTTIGGLTLDSGDILATLREDDASVGDAPGLNTVVNDIFVLKVTQSEPEPGNLTAATAEMVLDGSLVNLDGTERPYAIALVPDDYAPVPSITLAADITADDVVNAAEAGGNVAITGTVGGDASDGDTVTLTVNGTGYTGTVAGGAFSINVAGADLVADADTTIDASISSTDTAGNTGTGADTEGYGVDTTAPAPSITLAADITADDVVNAAEAAGNVTLTGTVGGDAADGDTVTLTVNGTGYTGTVAGGAFSINVAGADLVADADSTIDASISSTDTAGNTGTGADTEGYGVDITAPAVTVTSLTTSDSTPALSGTVSADATGVQVTVNGNTYAATKVGAAWSLADNTIAPALADGTYDVSVSAADAAGNTGTDVTLNELVINTSTPNTAPALGNASFIVDSASPSGAVLGMLSATDPNVGDTLTYSITAGNAAGAFAIDPATGQMTLANAGALDLSTLTHSLTVQVTDSGAPNLSATATVDITLSVAAPPIVPGPVIIPPPPPPGPSPIDTGGADDDTDATESDEEEPEDRRQGSGTAQPNTPTESTSFFSEAEQPSPLAGTEGARGGDRDRSNPRVAERPDARVEAPPVQIQPGAAAAEPTRTPEMQQSPLWEALDLMGQQMNDAEEWQTQQREQRIYTKTTAGVVLTLSAGAVTWLVRAGSLVASLLGSMPMWRGFDPLPVLLTSESDRKRLMTAIEQQEAAEAADQPKVGTLFEVKKKRRWFRRRTKR